MSSNTYIPNWLRAEIAAEFQNRCAYCQSPQDLIGALYHFQFEMIVLHGVRFFPTLDTLDTLGHFRHPCVSNHYKLQTVLFEVDHIIPLSKGGETIKDNLCWCCPLCNRYKQNQTMARDAQTGQQVKLFHPRQQRWTRHFKWNDQLTHIIGQTRSGRATVEALKLNNDHIMPLRRIWVLIGRHPSSQTAS